MSEMGKLSVRSLPAGYDSGDPGRMAQEVAQVASAHLSSGGGEVSAEKPSDG
jgi:hypothetical protein